MKKLFLIIIVLFSLNGYTQKTFEVYNYTAHNLVIVDITTSASGAYPEYSAGLPGGGTIVLSPGSSYILVNTASLYRFPFQSPLSSPYIANWLRRTSPTVATSLTSPAAWLLGSNQSFDRMAFRLIRNTGVVTTGTISTAVPNLGGNDWQAVYEMFVDPNNPNIINYTIVFF